MALQCQVEAIDWRTGFCRAVLTAEDARVEEMLSGLLTVK